MATNIKNTAKPFFKYGKDSFAPALTPSGANNDEVNTMPNKAGK